MVSVILILVPIAVLIALAIIGGAIFWWAMRRKKAKALQDPPRPVTMEAQPITEYMVGPEEASRPEPAYQPSPVLHPEDLETYQAGPPMEYHPREDAEVVELPIPMVEEIDASWVDLDPKRDFNEIMGELDRKDIDCYEILGVEENASKQEIHKAYRKLASRYHPDRGTSVGSMSPEELTERIREINFSKEVLLDPNLRAMHDRMVRDRGESEDPESRFDPSMLDMFPDESEEGHGTMATIIDEDQKGRGLGVLFFRKWSEDVEHFTDQFMDYILEMDEHGYVDYGSVMRGDVSDMDEISRLKKVSNFAMAANNALLDVWVLPPFYYMAIPVRKREDAQKIAMLLNDAFSLQSIFFGYPET